MWVHPGFHAQNGEMLISKIGFINSWKGLLCGKYGNEKVNVFMFHYRWKKEMCQMQTSYIGQVCYVW